MAQCKGRILVIDDDAKMCEILRYFLGAAAERGLTIEELEREYILKVLEQLGWNKARAAKALGLDRTTLYRKLERYGKAT